MSRPVGFDLPQSAIQIARLLGQRVAVHVKLPAFGIELIAVGVQLLPGGLQRGNSLDRFFRPLCQLDLPRFELFHLLAVTLPLVFQFGLPGRELFPLLADHLPLAFERAALALEQFLLFPPPLFELGPAGFDAFQLLAGQLPFDFNLLSLRLSLFTETVHFVDQPGAARGELFRFVAELFLLLAQALGVALRLVGRLRCADRRWRSPL